jgi:hypothetical protein
MKLNNLELLNTYIALNTIAKEKLPIMLSYQIEMIRGYIEPFAKTVDEMILEIKKRYAATNPISGEFIYGKDANGNLLPNTLVLEDAKQAEKEINEFLIQQLEIPSVKIKISLFPNDFRISADTLRLMKGIIEL